MNLKEKPAKIKIAVIVCIVIALIAAFALLIPKEDKKTEEPVVDLDFKYLENQINIDNVLNGMQSLDESSEDAQKVKDWLTSLRDNKKEGLETLNTEKHTYIYYGARCNEDETLGFTYDKSIETKDSITFKISVNKYKNDGEKNTEHTYENTIFCIDKTNKELRIE